MTDSDLWGGSGWADLLRLAPLTAQRAVGMETSQSIQIVSAASVLRRPLTGPDWIALGDAALPFDPLCRQGVYKSIETGTRSSSAIARYLGGDTTSRAEYEDWVNESFQSYLSVRTGYYSSVRRWPEARFWKRRAAASPRDGGQ